MNQDEKKFYDWYNQQPPGSIDGYTVWKAAREILQAELEDDQQMCESCDKKFDYDVMQTDGGDNYFCPECWKELEPVMRAEYEELKARGEIEAEEDESEAPPIQVAADVEEAAKAFFKENSYGYEGVPNQYLDKASFLKFATQWQANINSEGWISVETPPKGEGLYLAYVTKHPFLGKKQDVHVVYYGFGLDEDLTQMEWSCQMQHIELSHWMPLPKPPIT